MTLKILFVNALLIISAATVYGQSLDLSTYTPMYYDHSTGKVIQEPEKKQQDDIQIIKGYFLPNGFTTEKGWKTVYLKIKIKKLFYGEDIQVINYKKINENMWIPYYGSAEDVNAIIDGQEIANLFAYKVALSGGTCYF